MISLFADGNYVNEVFYNEGLNLSDNMTETFQC